MVFVLGAFWFDHNVYLAPLTCPDSKEEFTLPIGPSKKFSAELFASANESLARNYSLIVGYKRPVMSPLHNSTPVPGPDFKFRNFPVKMYHEFCGRAGLDSACKDLLGTLIREIYSKGMSCESKNFPDLSTRPFFSDGTSIGIVPKPRTVNERKSNSEDTEAVGHGASSAVTDDTILSQENQESAHRSSENSQDSTLQDLDTPPQSIEDWWKKILVPIYFRSLDNVQ